MNDIRKENQGQMISLNHEEYRIIWILKDGRKIYSCKRNRPELWSLEEIDQIVETKPHGFGCYTSDFGVYFPSEDVAHSQVPPEHHENLIFIIGYLIQRMSQKVIEDWLPSSLKKIEEDK